MNIAIIPARGGSKRIPGKNIKFFHGKPIIAYSIEAALESGMFDKVIVSTDDKTIADVAVEYGAEVPFMRPAAIADDFASTMDVMQHGVSACEALGWPIEAVCCIYATAPFLTAKYLNKGYQELVGSDAAFVFSATQYSFPIQRAIKLSQDGSVSMFEPDNEKTRSQDLEEAYHDAGQFYWGKKSAFLQKQSIFSPHSRVVVLPRTQVQDIDTPEDWHFAEALFLLLKQTGC